MKSTTAIGIGLAALVFAAFGTPVIIFRYKQQIGSDEWVSSNPTLFWVFLSLFILSMIGLVVGIVLKQRKSV